MPGDFETWRRWDGVNVKCDLLNVTTYYVKSGTRIAEQASICVYKACTFIYIFLSFR